MQRKWCTMRKITYGVAMILLACFLCVLPVQAEQTGSVTVQVSMAGAVIELYQVADADFNYVNGFDAAGVPLKHLSDSDLPKALEKVITDSTEHRTDVSSVSGLAAFSNLSKGVYLVRQSNQVPGYESFDAFLVTIPMKQDGKWIYNVDASPKLSVIPKPEEPSEPEEPTEPTTPDEPVVPTTEETEVTEEPGTEIPVQPVQPGTETDTSSDNQNKTGNDGGRLPQTGQLVWPIPVLAFLGLCFVVIGKKLHEE